MDGCSRMDIRSIKGTNRILTGTHFEFPDISRVLWVSPRILTVPPEGIGGYRPTTEGMVRISAVYGEGHEGDRGPLPPPFLHSFFTLALLL
jgi:hypothetical protein